MKKYIEFKLIEAIPMYNSMSDEDGYKIKYENGKTSWNPKHIFEKNYKSIEDGMEFGLAIYLLKFGYKVTRREWNDKGIFLEYIDSHSKNHYTDCENSETSLTLQPYIAISTKDNQLSPWIPSQMDIASNDWEIVDEVTTHRPKNKSLALLNN